MKKVKTGIWVLIVAFVAILIYQNQQFFMAGQSLRLNLLFTEYQSPEWKIVMICAGFFVAGLILGMYFLVIYHLRSKRKRKTQQLKAEKPDERISAPEPVAKPRPTVQRGSDAETVVITPEVTPPVAERREP
ncbi:MAG: hypothetical protein AMJ54_06795 [Deltaproteobacteria bacterium SG8_13]|nr:MAG: hypothetical protein AMJ54_06795 [Deltaproteobacteria bacterium SG8_13]